MPYLCAQACLALLAFMDDSLQLCVMSFQAKCWTRLPFSFYQGSSQPGMKPSSPALQSRCFTDHLEKPHKSGQYEASQNALYYYHYRLVPQTPTCAFRRSHKRRVALRKSHCLQRTLRCLDHCLCHQVPLPPRPSAKTHLLCRPFPTPELENSNPSLPHTGIDHFSSPLEPLPPYFPGGTQKLWKQCIKLCLYAQDWDCWINPHIYSFLKKLCFL